MSTPDSTRWLDWCSRLQAMAQTGLTFANDPYDIARYEALRAIAAEMLAAGSGADVGRIRDFLTKDPGDLTPVGGHIKSRVLPLV